MGSRPEGSLRNSLPIDNWSETLWKSPPLKSSHKLSSEHSIGQRNIFSCSSLTFCQFGWIYSHVNYNLSWNYWDNYNPFPAHHADLLICPNWPNLPFCGLRPFSDTGAAPLTGIITELFSICQIILSHTPTAWQAAKNTKTKHRNTKVQKYKNYLVYTLTGEICFNVGYILKSRCKTSNQVRKMCTVKCEICSVHFNGHHCEVQCSGRRFGSALWGNWTVSCTTSSGAVWSP